MATVETASEASETGRGGGRGAAPPGVADPAVAAVLRWWSENRRPLPWRASRDVYAIHVSEVMAVQTTVGRAADAWVAWIERWPTVQALADASLADVLEQWQGLGYPRRARDLHRSARIVVAAGWPRDLTELPGVGPYIADAIRCFALEEPVLPRDVNVTRVLRRRFPAGVDTSGDPWRAGQALMEFGQRICTPRPRCGGCPARRGCPGPEAPGDGGPPRRARPRFEGSDRQRRGRLLRHVLAEGAVAVDEAEAGIAAGLAEDGLILLAHGVARPPR